MPRLHLRALDIRVRDCRHRLANPLLDVVTNAVGILDRDKFRTCAATHRQIRLTLGKSPFSAVVLLVNFIPVDPNKRELLHCVSEGLLEMLQTRAIEI